jgi:hypothetical protein
MTSTQSCPCGGNTATAFGVYSVYDPRDEVSICLSCGFTWGVKDE